MASAVVLWSGGTTGGRLFRLATVAGVGAGTIVVVRTWSSRWWAVAGLPAGMLGVVAGGGVGPRHLGAGASLVGVAGSVLLAAGLVVTVGSSIGVIRAARGRARLWALPAGAVVAVLLLPSVVAVAASDVPPTPLSGRSASELAEDAVAVGFPARDGTGLRGWWVPSRNGAALVVLHGSGSNREAVLGQAKVLAAAGYGVLAFDARGHGESAGTGMDLGWAGEDDLGGALDFVVAQAGIDEHRVGALGLSMGGEEAVATLGDPLLSAVVAEGVTGRGASDDGWKPDHIGGVLQRGMDRWQDRLTQLLTGMSPPPSLRSRVATDDTPVLLVASGDRPDEASAARWLQEAAPTSVEVWVVPGAPHTGALATAPEEWTTRVLAFLGRTIGPVSP